MCASVYYNLKSNSTHTSYVELADALVVPAVAESHRSYETSVTSSDEADVYDHDQAVGIEVMPPSVCPRPTFKSKFASALVAKKLTMEYLSWIAGGQ
jgi:hypothetical protein